MLSEEFVSSVRGPPLSTSTAFAKDAGIYTHTLTPTFGLKSTLKKSSTPANCLAASETHVFAAQHEKAYVHVYSRVRGSQEAFVPFAERIHSLALIGNDLLVLGTAEGRLLLWEVCTGRLVSTPARHVQAVCALATTRLHVLTGSEDSNIHVWSLLGLLELGSVEEHEPERSLTSHRAAITSLVANGSSNTHTDFCVSASKDKTCIIWNYHTGESLRTILFPSAPSCIALDPAGRAAYAASEDGSIFLVEFFGKNKTLIGPHSVEDPSTVVQTGSPFGISPPDAGPALCLGLTYDGTALLTGHANGQVIRWGTSSDKELPTDLANLNAAVTNIVPLSPLPRQRPTKAMTVVRPTAAERRYTLQSQFTTDLGADEKFDALLRGEGFPQDVLVDAIAAFQQPSLAGQRAADSDLQRQNEELWQIINEQRALQMEMLQRYPEVKQTAPPRAVSDAAGRGATSAGSAD